MTREQEVERQLAEWIVEGPNMAPEEVVDQALQQTIGRPQRRGLRRLLAMPLEGAHGRRSANQVARMSALAAVIAGILLTSIIIAVPLGGSSPGASPTPGPSPPMEEGVIRTIVGTATEAIESETPTELVRSVDVTTGDERVDGRARQELAVFAAGADTAYLRGTMHLQNPWGAWDGPVDVVRYPSGEEYEYASLLGSGAYEGFTYQYTVRQASAEAERTVEGAIWPDEPPPPPDPSLLP